MPISYKETTTKGFKPRLRGIITATRESKGHKMDTDRETIKNKHRDYDET